MYRNIYIAVMLLSPFLFLNSARAGSYDSTNFTSAGRAFQPVPTGHIPGKDNGVGIGTHGVGEDCGICHRETNSTTPGKASKYLFTMAGTLYEDKGSTRPLKGGEVILQDINGKVISMTSNEVGNFWTYEPIGSNPQGVNGYSSTPPGYIPLYTTDAPAPATDTRAWQYKTWVKNGGPRDTYGNCSSCRRGDLTALRGWGAPCITRQWEQGEAYGHQQKAPFRLILNQGSALKNTYCRYS